VIIHRAILGSVERMMAVLIEHTGGKWPFWLSPRQVSVVPVTEHQTTYARHVYEQLHADGLYAHLDDSSNTLNKKIREAQLDQFNLIVVVGAKEEAAKTVTVRKRDDPDHQSQMGLDDFKRQCHDMVREWQ
jgi:threonyl-tRNA synthetase